MASDINTPRSATVFRTDHTDSSNSSILARINFRQIVEAAGVGITKVETRTGRIFYANPAFCRMSGYAQEDFAGFELTFLELTHPDDRRKNSEEHQKLLRGSVTQYTLEKRYLRKDGSFFWGRVTVTRLLGRRNTEPCSIAYIQDISREKLLRQQLALAEGLGKTATWSHHFGLNVMTCSSAYNELYGLPPETPAPTLDEFFSRIHAEDRPIVSSAIHASINGQTYCIDFRVPLPDGRTRLLRGIGTTVKDASGDVTSWVGSIREINETKAAALNEASDDQQPEAAPEMISGSGSRFSTVETYIRTHWNRPITLDQLAKVANTSVRQLFRMFRQNANCTPKQFTKRVRLEHARAMLLNPEAERSVTGAAFSCGFQNAGHFAADYREAYGELPSETLKKHS